MELNLIKLNKVEVMYVFKALKIINQKIKKRLDFFFEINYNKKYS